MREVIDLAVPAILTQLSFTAMGVIDAALVGRLGATELAATGFGSVWVWTAFNFFFGAASVAQTFVAQTWGAGRNEECGAWAWQALYLVLAPVLVAALAIGWAIGPLLAWAGPSVEMQTAAKLYVVPVLFGAPGLAIAFVLSSFFRGHGDTRTPLYATLVANALNAVLDYGLIFGKLGLPELGIVGAGIATAIGQWVYCLVLWVAFRRPRVARLYVTHPIAPNLQQMRRLLRTGAPIGGQWVLGELSFAVFSTVIARMGDASAAASQAFVVLLSLSFMQAMGISVAASTLVARYIGAGDLPSAHKSYRSSQKLAAGLGILVGALFIAIPEWLLRVFTDDPAVVTIGRSLAVTGAIFQLFDAFGIVAGGSLRGAGDTRWPFLLHALLAWGLFVPLTWVFGVALQGGVLGAWIAGAVYVGVLSALLVWRFASGRWERIRI